MIKRRYQDGLRSSDQYGTHYNTKISRIKNAWKVNLSAVMPRTAALTEEDFIAAYEEQNHRTREFAVQSVLDLVAHGYVGVVEAFKQLNTQQAREVIFSIQPNLLLREGEESTINSFNENYSAQEDIYKHCIVR